MSGSSYAHCIFIYCFIELILTPTVNSVAAFSRLDLNAFQSELNLGNARMCWSRRVYTFYGAFFYGKHLYFSCRFQTTPIIQSNTGIHYWYKCWTSSFLLHYSHTLNRRYFQFGDRLQAHIFPICDVLFCALIAT